MSGSDKSDKKGSNQGSKVIDISERISERQEAQKPTSRLGKLKVRLDLEQAKIAIPASIMSILVVVTLANSKLLTEKPVIESRDLASEGTPVQTRGIASVPTGTSDEEDRLVKDMAQRNLSDAASLGRAPTAIEKFAIEQLEGKYSVRMNAGKLSALELNARSTEPVAFDSKLLEQSRGILPVAFEKSIRVASETTDKEIHETYHLVNSLSMPLAEVQVRLNETHHLLGMKVVPTNVSGQ